MVIKRSFLIPVALTVLLLFSSCDTFWNMPWGKSQFDPSSQIGAMRAVRAGGGEIAVAWDWRPFLDGDPVFGIDIDPKREIVELRLLHGTGSPPVFSPPLPFTDALTDRLDPDGWYEVFDDLKEDREHYFSIYGKEKSGQWVGPWTVSRHVDWDGGTESPVLSPVTSWAIDIAGQTVPGGAGTIVTDGTWAAVYVYDPMGYDNMGFVESALGTTISALTATAAGTISFYPLRFAWDGAVDGYDILMNSRFTRDETGAVHKTIADLDTAVSLEPAEVKRLVMRMALLGSWRMLVEATNGGSASTFSGPVLDFTYWWN